MLRISLPYEMKEDGVTVEEDVDTATQKQSVFGALVDVVDFLVQPVEHVEHEGGTYKVYQV